MDQSTMLTSIKDIESISGDLAISKEQLNKIFKKTPAKFIKVRKGKGGRNFRYVSGGYVRKALNLLFGWDWDFKIMESNKDHVMMASCDEAIVLGQLTCRTSSGRTIVKQQYGCKDIVFKKGTKNPVSLGNDFKAAATDCLKKCAAEIGIAQDIYYPDEFKEVQFTDDDLPQKKFE